MIQPLASALVPDSLDETGRVAADHSTWFHVPGDHGPGGHDSAVAHGDARKQDGARAHPHIIAQPHRLRRHAAEASNILGEVRIACGESDAVAFLAKAAKGLQRSHPGVTYRLLSGDGDFVADRLDRGAADIGLLVTSSIDSADYGFMKVPAKDTWGVLMAEDAALAKLDRVTPDDLAGEPLLLPYRASMGSDLMSWFKDKRESLNVVATYDLAYNASRFAREGLGYAVALDGIVDAKKTAATAKLAMS